MSPYGEQFESSGLQFAWNASSLKAWEKCPRYYQYTIVEGWGSREESVHLAFGSHYAWALMRYWQLRHEGADRAEARASVVESLLERTWDRTHKWEPVGDGDEVVCATCGQLGKSRGENDCSGRPWSPEDKSAKDRFTLIRSFIWYLDEFRDDLPLLQTSRGPAVEQQFRISADDGIVFVGTLDRVVVYDDSPWVMDQKSTGQTLSHSYFRQYHLDTQMSMYPWAGQAIFSLPVKGVIIDAVQIAVGFSRFGRGLTYRTASQLEEWYQESMRYIEAARSATREAYFPRRTSACSMYGGCAFREVCEATPEVRKTILSRRFVKKER